MEICEDGHEQVCHDLFGKCPACKIREDLEDQIADLESENNDLEKRLDALEDE
jgi:hypothetical protein